MTTALPLAHVVSWRYGVLRYVDEARSIAAVVRHLLLRPLLVLAAARASIELALT